MGEVGLPTLDLDETFGLPLIAEVKKVIVVLKKHCLELLVHCFALFRGHVPVTHNILRREKG